MNWLQIIRIKIMKSMKAGECVAHGIGHAARLFCEMAYLYHSISEQPARDIKIATREYGRKRGAEIRDRVLDSGKPLTLANFFVHSDLSSDGYKMRVAPKSDGLELRVIRCPFREAAQKVGKLDMIEPFCAVIDESILGGYNRDLSVRRESVLDDGRPVCILRFRQTRPGIASEIESLHKSC